MTRYTKCERCGEPIRITTVYPLFAAPYFELINDAGDEVGLPHLCKNQDDESRPE
jgi:RNA polymerase-binding transcription factor DksA